MELDSSRGLRKLLQLDERVPASIHPTFENLPTRHVLPIKGLNDPNYHQQLLSRALKPDYSSPIPPKLGIIQAYGCSANPTSTRSATSQYMPLWRSVARWETNGADLLPSARCEMNDQDSGRAAYELCSKLGCMDENTVRSMNLSFLRPDEPGYSPTVCASEMEQEYGQIAQPCLEINAEPLPL